MDKRKLPGSRNPFLGIHRIAEEFIAFVQQGTRCRQPEPGDDGTVPGTISRGPEGQSVEITLVPQAIASINAVGKASQRLERTNKSARFIQT